MAPSSKRAASPTQFCKEVATLAPEAADMMAEVCVCKPVSIATRLGVSGEVLHALLPRVAQIVMNTSFRMFPTTRRRQCCMRIEDIRQRLRAAGAKPVHEQRVLRLWAQALPQDTGRRRPEDFLPLSVRDALPALMHELQGLACLQSEHPAEDGSARLLVQLADGQSVEGVLLPRDGVCVSSQVGCAVGCVFCMTGRDGLLRQVGSAEIVAQVVLARTRRVVKKVVFMGMGEPAHNLDNVLEAIELLGTAGGIGHKNIVFSTVGDPRVFERLLLGVVKPALALSLHSTRADLRAQLLPRAPRMSPVDLVEQGERYARTTGYPIQYQWTLLEGINDNEAELDGIVALLRGKYAVMNMIPYNSVEGLDFKRPAWERCATIARSLHRRGVLTKLRHSAGQDVDGGCGQLRARSRATEAPVVLVRRPVTPWVESPTPR